MPVHERILANRAVRVVAALAIVLLLAWGIDSAVNGGRIYAGVKVGEIDLSGMTVEEATVLLDNAYSPRVSTASVHVCDSDDTAARISDAALAAQDGNADAQQTIEEARAQAQLWSVNAQTLAASFDAASHAQRAFSVGRDDGGLFARIGAALAGTTIEPAVTFGDGAIEALASAIDATIGDPRIDFDIAVENGVAQVTEGHDGQMVNRDVFASEISRLLLAGEEGAVYTARCEYAPVRIDRAQAQAVCDQVNAAIAPGALFSCAHHEWQASAAEIGSWVDTSVVEEANGFRLVPSLDASVAKSILLSHLKGTLDGENISVRFEETVEGMLVHADTDETIPEVDQAVTDLDRALFGSDAVPSSDGSPVAIPVGDTAVPESMAFDEALDAGVIGLISEFTTTYTIEPLERQHNIHLASDLITESIVTANGGVWSFNETAGHCNEEAGFQPAGAIVSGEYVDAVGGGICQVATTVFNAVYDSGLPVLTRHNHTLLISSYPAGRDAAVSWPDLDLRWSNDTGSDVLLVMSYTDTTVTASLYGVNPDYTVTSETGEWQKGREYSTEVIVDENLAEGSRYVQTAGADGSMITVVRTVTDETGATVRQDAFTSVYDAIDEVVIEGPEPVPDDPATPTDDDASDAAQGSTSGSESEGLRADEATGPSSQAQPRSGRARVSRGTMQKRATS